LVELLNSEQIAGAHSFKRRAPLLPRLRRAPDATPCAWRQRALARAANGCIERDDDGRDVMAAATGDGLMTQRMIGGGSGGHD
jgi:hypothetical protein